MKKISILLCSLALLGGCSQNFPEFYRPNLKQGVILSNAHFEGLHLGMTRTEVLQYLGTPPIADPFHTNRWDYVYLYFPDQNRARGVENYARLYFDDAGLLENIEKTDWEVAR